MKVLTESPIRFITGDVLDPRDLNAAWLYAKRALQDAVDRAWHPWTLPLQLVYDCTSVYTDSTEVETRSIRFKAPFDVVLDRAELVAHLTSDAEVQLILEDTLGGTPEGASDPLLSTGGASADAADEITDLFVGRIRLVADTEYIFKVVPVSGAMEIQRFDVILHGLTNRWTVAGIAPPSFEPTLLSDMNAPDAEIVATNNALLAAEVAKLATYDSAPVPMLFIAHDFAVGTDADLLKFILPVFDTFRAESMIVRAYLFVEMGDGGGTTVTATITDEGGNTELTVTADVAGETQVSEDDDLDHEVVQAKSFTESIVTTTRDYMLQFANPDAGTQVDKAVFLIWVDRF